MNISGGFFTRRLRRDAAKVGDNELIARLLLRNCFCVDIFRYHAMKTVSLWALQKHNTFVFDIPDTWKFSLRLFFIMFQSIPSFFPDHPFLKWEKAQNGLYKVFLVYNEISFQ